MAILGVEMRTTTGTTSRALAGLLGACLFASFPALAQHGHPLVGSWSGDWTPPDGRQRRLLLVLEYEDDTISGEIFFGTRRIPLRRATLDPASWTVRFEAEDADADGGRIEYMLEGRIENLGSTTVRTIGGSLSANAQRGDFRVVMN